MRLNVKPAARISSASFRFTTPSTSGACCLAERRRFRGAFDLASVVKGMSV